jgi:hypothetical protein
LLSEFSVKKTPTVSGSISLSGGALVGYSSWPSASSPLSGLGLDPGFAFSPAISLDVRPDAGLRFHGTLSLDYPDRQLAPQVSDVFVDYLLADWASFRVGSYDLTWGNARVFLASSLPSRLDEDSDGADNGAGNERAVLFKGAVPIGKASLTGLVTLAMDPAWANTGFGALADIPVGPLSMGLSAFYQAQHPFRASLNLKTALWGFDLFSDLVFTHAASGEYCLSEVAGFMRAWKNPDITLYGEYLYNGESGLSSVTDALYPRYHASALAVLWRHVGGSALSASAQWQHGWADNSGVILAGGSLGLAPRLTAQFLVPCVYGADGSDYVSRQAESLADVTHGLRLGLELGLTLAFNF